MSTIKIDKDDAARILLTEVLPYEVPIIFSNEGFYRFVISRKKKPRIVSDILKKWATIPFNYRIRKSQSAYRSLSLIHPSIQLEFIQFYRNYDALIIDLCKRSPFTLRSPSRVASWFNLRGALDVQKEINEGVETDGNEPQGEQAHASSYFAYNKYDFLYKFFESYEFHDLEKKFSKMLTFDISKCFPSIYSHTIAWAVKDKYFAKQNIGRDGFESMFDELMQRANYKETNGIVVGPEVSRIFAEIILQRIDLNVMKRLEALETGGLKSERDYSVRRYVDDYFVFTNREEIQERIASVFIEELEKFRLFVNDSKTQRTTVPFITEITVAKTKIKNLLEQLLDNLVDVRLSKTEEEADPGADSESKSDDSSLHVINLVSPHRMASKMIMELKSTVKTHHVEYDSVSAFILVQARKWFFRVLSKEQFKELGSSDPVKVRNVIWVFLDVMFFVYSMDPRVRCTYIMSQIVVNLNAFLKNMPNELTEDLRKKIFDESIRLIRNVRMAEDGPSVEVLNLVIALRDLGKDYLLSKEAFTNLLNIVRIEEKSPPFELNYFQLVTILFYIKSDSRYRGIRNGIERMVLRRFQSEQNPFHDTELTCLFFDVMACPYVRKLTKKALVMVAYKSERKRVPSPSELNELIKHTSSRNWFTNWSKKITLEQLLMKKELRQAYI